MLVAEQKAIASRGLKYMIAFLLLWAGPYIYVDIQMPDSNGAYFLLSFVGIGLTFFLLYSLLRSSSAHDEATKTGIAGFFGLSLLHSIAVFAGLLLFVIPGLYLAMRWLPAFARLLKSDEGIIEALRWSWERTGGYQSALAVPFMWVMSLYLLGMGPILGWELLYQFTDYVSYETLDSLYEPSVVLSNIALAVGAAWYTTLGVASYVCLRGEARLEAETFE
ncbi:hypothetical protein EH31_00445 [Erythrobacter longus]|uniref:Uncharacterized protein n=2 Tax=Erythrobacter longus TaxID=1044 RepID=A0A074M8R4_ERYLO|nr:hypothetical protein EH31_00445 [Erythrobacter longus]